MSFKRAFMGASVLGTVLACGATAFAQDEVSTPKTEIGLGYSGIHVSASDTVYQRSGNGGFGYLEYNVNKVVGVVADFGGYANTGKDGRLFTYLFGPRFNWRHSRLNPYVQFLFGGAYLWNNPQYSATQNAFATAAGGGVDYRLSNHIAIKPLQVEYVTSQFSGTNGIGSHQNDVRYSAGVVFEMGSK